MFAPEPVGRSKEKMEWMDHMAPVSTLALGHDSVYIEAFLTEYQRGIANLLISVRSAVPGFSSVFHCCVIFHLSGNVQNFIKKHLKSRLGKAFSRPGFQARL